MDKKKAIDLVRNTFEESFSEERLIFFLKEFLNEVDIINAPVLNDVSHLPDYYKQHIKQYKCIGTYKDPNGEWLDVLSVELERETSLERARAMQRNFVGWYLKNEGFSKDHALVAFYHEDVKDWRFSYLERGYKTEIDKGTGRIKAEEELTSARRFSFLVGENEPSHTAQTQMLPVLQNDNDNPVISAIKNTFEVETVTDEFFDEYKKLLEKLEDALNKVAEEDSKIKSDFEDKGVYVPDFANKLLSQIVFLCFLQKKGWFGVKRDEEWGCGSKNFLRELFDEKHSSYENFFNDILEPLFYEALAYKRSGDYYKRFDSRIPFLNGGLFEPINNYNWISTNILLPDTLFSNTNSTDWNDIGDGILDIFDRYNFTVKEDEPLEREVAVDPEMLGKIFENLVLGDEERKAKGTYYTPRKIVHYMCQESLINYIHAHLDSSVNREDVEKLIEFGEQPFNARYLDKHTDPKATVSGLPDSIVQNAAWIDKRLEDIRVCDPAVGSGAFIVAMMNEITRIRSMLTQHISHSGARTSYSFKRNAIKNCLYGVDIDPSAVEIAKLRLWLSLIVDEEERSTIKPLPNLDYKIVKGNSLIKCPKFYYTERLDAIEKKQEEYYEKTDIEEKQEIKNEIEQLMRNVGEALGYAFHFDFRIVFFGPFREKNGFDVVIGNPPYVQLQKMRNNPVREIYRELKYETYDGYGDIYCLFYERGIEITCDGGILCYISSNKWMRAGYGEKLRKFFLGQNPLTLIDLGPNVFKKATVDTNIIFVQKSKNQDCFKGMTLTEEDDNTDIKKTFKRKSFDLSYLNNAQWFVGSKAEAELKQKIERIGKPLKEWDISIYRGIITGCNEAFIVDNETKEALFEGDSKSDELIKPVLRGRDIQRYQVKWDGLWLIDTHNGYGDVPPIDVENYKAIKEHLDKFYSELEKRQDKGITPYNLRSCAYYAEFMRDKIVYREISNSLNATYIEATKPSIFVNNKLYIITGESLKYLLACLNSKVMSFIMLNNANFGGGKGRDFLGNISVPQATQREQQPIIDLVNQILDTKTVSPNADTMYMEEEIEQLVYQLYGLTNSEIRIIENYFLSSTKSISASVKP